MNGGKIMHNCLWRVVLIAFVIDLNGCGLWSVASPRATSMGFEVLEFTSQVQFPGVESNLYATEVFRVKLNGEFPEGAQRFELWIDSVAIPVRLIEDRSGMSMNMAPGRRLDVRFSANRHRYRQGTSGSITLPTETYRLTGSSLEDDMAWFVYSDRWGNLTYWQLGPPMELPKLYAP